MVSAGLGSLFSIYRFSENSEIQQGCGLQNVVFQLACVALENGLADVLGDGQQEEFTRYFDIPCCQESDELAVVLQLPEGTLCLDGAIYPEQLAFFCGNSPE